MLLHKLINFEMLELDKVIGFECEFDVLIFSGVDWHDSNINDLLLVVKWLHNNLLDRFAILSDVVFWFSP